MAVLAKYKECISYMAEADKLASEKVLEAIDIIAASTFSSLLLKPPYAAK